MKTRSLCLFTYLALTSPAALAQEEAAPAPVAAASPAAPDPTRYLRLESDFWGVYGVKLSRSGQEFGPGFLASGLEDAVRGSTDAERHANSAQIWAGVNLGFGLASAGLLVASLVTYEAPGGGVGGWPDFVPRDGGIRTAALNLGWLLSLTASVVSRYMTYEAIMLSVNAYNRDLVEGRLR